MADSKRIELLDGELIIELDGKGGGRVWYSNLADEDDVEDEAARVEQDIHNARVEGLERLVLACAVAGVDVETAKFKTALQTAADALTNAS